MTRFLEKSGIKVADEMHKAKKQDIPSFLMGCFVPSIMACFADITRNTALLSYRDVRGEIDRKEKTGKE